MPKSRINHHNSSRPKDAYIRSWISAKPSLLQCWIRDILVLPRGTNTKLEIWIKIRQFSLKKMDMIMFLKWQSVCLVLCVFMVYSKGRYPWCMACHRVTMRGEAPDVCHHRTIQLIPSRRRLSLCSQRQYDPQVNHFYFCNTLIPHKGVGHFGEYIRKIRWQYHINTNYIDN